MGFAPKWEGTSFKRCPRRWRRQELNLLVPEELIRSIPIPRCREKWWGDATLIREGGAELIRSLFFQLGDETAVGIELVQGEEQA